MNKFVKIKVYLQTNNKQRKGQDWLNELCIMSHLTSTVIYKDNGSNVNNKPLIFMQP